jgi:hypothetical protein
MALHNGCLYKYILMQQPECMMANLNLCSSSSSPSKVPSRLLQETACSSLGAGVAYLEAEHSMYDEEHAPILSISLFQAY